MASIRAKRALKNIIENRGMSTSKAMKLAGYKDATAKNPKNLTQSKSFIELCDELGLTDELLAKSLLDDVKAKPANRYNELTLMAKLKGKLTDKHEVKVEKVKPILGGLSNE